MKTVLVTGATGLIGRQVVRQLSAGGNCIVALSGAGGAPDEVSGPGVKWRQADILDRAAMAKIVQDSKADSLMHLAWATGPELRDSVEDNLIWADASIALIEAFARNGGRRVVFAGSCAEYDWRDGDACAGNLREHEAPLSQVTALGRGKRKVSYYLEASQPVSAATGRIFFCHGEGEKPNRLIPQAVLAALKKQPFTMGPGGLLRDYMDTRDVAAALCRLSESSLEATVNVCSGKGVSLDSIARSVFSLCDADPALIRRNLRPGSAGAPHRLVGDDTLLREKLGFRTRYGLTQGLQNSIEWWSRNMK